MAVALASETVNVRKISWAEFYRLRPDLKPQAANDNQPAGKQAANAKK